MAWFQLTVDTTPEGASRLCQLLDEAGASAVSLHDAADEALLEPAPGETPLWKRVRLAALFDATRDPRALVESLRKNGENAALGPWRVEVVEERDWTRAWMDQFQPVHFGGRLWVCPSWETPRVAGAVNVVLDPGLAFGTGTHPTTRLCMEWLALADLEERGVLDYGCGSGILAIAAARLGARHVWAADIDDQALQATRENARRNAVDHKVDACCPADLPEERLEIVLANILAKPLIDAAPVIAARLAPGGVLVLSGILSGQGDTLETAYAPWFDAFETTESEGWLRVVATRRAC